MYVRASTVHAFTPCVHVQHCQFVFECLDSFSLFKRSRDLQGLV